MIKNFSAGFSRLFWFIVVVVGAFLACNALNGLPAWLELLR